MGGGVLVTKEWKQVRGSFVVCEVEGNIGPGKKEPATVFKASHHSDLFLD